MGAFVVSFFTVFFLAIGFLLLWNGNSLQGHCCSTTDDDSVDCSTKTNCDEPCKWKYWNCDGPFPWQSKYNGPFAVHFSSNCGTIIKSCKSGYTLDSTKKCENIDGGCTDSSCCIAKTCQDALDEGLISCSTTPIENPGQTRCTDKCTSDICCQPQKTCVDYTCNESSKISTNLNKECDQNVCNDKICECKIPKSAKTCSDWVTNNLDGKACPSNTTLMSDKECSDSSDDGSCNTNYCCESNGGVCCPNPTNKKPVVWDGSNKCLEKTKDNCNEDCKWTDGKTKCNFYQCKSYDSGSGCDNIVEQKELESDKNIYTSGDACKNYCGSCVATKDTSDNLLTGKLPKCYTKGDYLLYTKSNCCGKNSTTVCTDENNKNIGKNPQWYVDGNNTCK